MHSKYRRGDVLGIALILSVYVSLFALTQVTHSADGALWSSSSVVELEKASDITVDNFNTTQVVPCDDQEFTWKGWTGGWFQRVVTNKYTRCAVAMQDAYFETGSTVQGRIRSFSSDKTYGLEFPSLANINVFAVPNTTSLVINSYAYQNYYGGTSGLHIIRDYHATLTDSHLDSAGNKIIQPAKAFDFELRGADGKLIPIRTTGLKFSSNGSWMVFKLQYGGKFAWARINLDTYEVLAFSTPVQDQYAIYDAISNDGRYVVMYEPSSSLRVYDLDKCSNGADKFLSQQCAYVDLYDYTKAQLGANEIQFRNFVFKGEQSLSVYITSRKIGETQWNYGEYLLRYGELPTSNGYLAMGDSFSSGEGAYDYRSETDFHVDDSLFNRCHQSLSSYPYILNRVIGFEWFGSVACSGAERPHILNSPQAKPDAADSAVYSNFLPGYRGQKSFLDIKNSPSPQVATLTITGNDIGFGDILGRCAYSPGSCYSQRTEREQLANHIDQQIQPLTDLLKGLKNQNARPDFRLYVISYPSIISPDISCGRNVGIGFDEQVFADHLVKYLNRAIELAAANAGVRYVDAANALTDGAKDYRLCGNQKTLGVNGVVLFGTTSKMPDKHYYQESYHPNLLGHALMASKINRETVSLSASMPSLITPAKYEVDSAHRIALVDDDERLLSEGRYIYESQGIPEVATRGDELDFSTNKIKTDAKPGSKVIFEIHSSPIKIGEGAIGVDGGIVGFATIPNDIEPGYHEVHALYSDFFGELVDRYRIVFVAASHDDYDGDGIPNASDPCLIGVQSGIDEDEDSIDDACDDEYVKHEPDASGDSIKKEEVAKVLQGIAALAPQPQLVAANSNEVGASAVVEDAGGQVLGEGASTPDVTGVESYAGYAKEKPSDPNGPLIVVVLLLAVGVVVSAIVGTKRFLKVH